MASLSLSLNQFTMVDPREGGGEGGDSNVKRPGHFGHSASKSSRRGAFAVPFKIA